MPTYVPKYECDVFVSYAAVDNQPLAGEETCWVTNLINTLKVRVAQKLGTNAYSLWIDYQSRADSRLENLEKSATFILILSPGYLLSKQCHEELGSFLRQLGNEWERISKIEYQPVELIPELKNILGYRFWKRDATDRPRTLGFPKPNPNNPGEYYDQIDNLATDLVEKLKYLKDQIKKNTNPTDDEKPKPKAIIFLAEVSDDLSLQREELKRNLELQGFGILPRVPYFFPNDEQKLCQAIDADLEESVVFVQLLSQFNPWRPVGMSTPQLQYDRAGSVNKKILQWRNSGLDVNTVVDPNHRTLLTNSTVMAVGIVEFQEYLLRWLNNKLSPPPPSPPPCELIFVNAEPNNIPLAQKIADVLAEKHGLGYILPIEISGDITPTQLREDLETNLEFCSAVLVLYNHPHELPWLRNQLLYCHRIRSRRNSHFKVIVCDNQPPDDKPPPNVKFPDLHILECVMPYHDSCVSCFIQVLRS